MTSQQLEKFLKKLRKPAISYFLSLTLKNTRCFGPTQTLKLSDEKGLPYKWTIILGNNGTGKTTILQSLASLVPIFRFPKLNEEVEPYWTLRFMETYPDYEGSVYEDEEEIKWRPYRHKDKQTNKRLYLKAIYSKGKKIDENQVGKKIKVFVRSTVKKPSVEYKILGNLLCCGYGATRGMKEKSILQKEDTDPTISLFIENTELPNAGDWLLASDIVGENSFIREAALKRREQIKKVLVKILPGVEAIRSSKPANLHQKPYVEVKTHFGWVSIRDLSLGYRSLIGWIVDLARRLFDRYPNSSNPLTEPAIVLIDEIDLHLHPQGQKSLIERINQIFTNTQFIVTAHSPLIVQAATNANIVLLKRHENQDFVTIHNDVSTIKGWRVDQILTSDLFELKSSRSTEYESIIEERKKILSKGQLTEEDRTKINQLELQIESLPTGQTIAEIEAMELIMKFAAKLKEDSSDNDKNK